MYKLTEPQIDKILNDIRIHGIETEDLQLNLLDHICCIIEDEYNGTSDFDSYCKSVYPRFYKSGFREIEDETQLLLTFKHFYAMKKLMFLTGIVSALSITTGSILKFLHLPPAGILIVFGIAVFTLVFLPLMFTLKFRESKHRREKNVLLLAIPLCIFIVLAVLFKIMHWPGANVMTQASLFFTIVIFIPIFLLTGIRNPETRVNTLTSSILILAGAGLFMSLATVMKSKATIDGEIKAIERIEVSLDRRVQRDQKLLAAFRNDATVKHPEEQLQFLEATLLEYNKLETEKSALLETAELKTPEEEISKSLPYFRNKSGAIERGLYKYQMANAEYLHKVALPDFEIDLYLSPGSSLLTAYKKLCDVQRDLLDNFELAAEN